MGYNINVNHNKFQEAADQINSYITAQNNGTIQIQNQLNGLFSTWKGEDADVLKLKSQNITSPASVSGKLKTTLTNYSGALQEAASQYRNAQATAVNRANMLIKYL